MDGISLESPQSANAEVSLTTIYATHKIFMYNVKMQ